MFVLFAVSSKWCVVYVAIITNKFAADIMKYRSLFVECRQQFYYSRSMAASELCVLTHAWYTSRIHYLKVRKAETSEC